LLRQQALTETAGATASVGEVWTPPLDYKAYHIAVTESLTSVDTDTEPETDLKLETTPQALTDSDTISVNLADASDNSPETVESIATAAVDSESDTVSINLAETEPAAAAVSDTVSDTVSVNLAATESASATAAVIPVTPAAPFVPAAIHRCYLQQLYIHLLLL